MSDAYRNKENRPGIAKVFFSFFKLGLTAFGGPAMVAYIRELSVDRNKWLSGKSFKQGVAVCQSIPGATAMQAAAYAGLRAAGGAGAVAAFVGFGLPAFVLMVVLSAVYGKVHDLASVISAFNGLQLIVIAIVANATINFGRSSLKKWQDFVLAVGAAFVLIMRGSPVAVIAGSALIGLVLYPSDSGSGQPEKNNSSSGMINDNQEVTTDKKNKTAEHYNDEHQHGSIINSEHGSTENQHNLSINSNNGNNENLSIEKQNSVSWKQNLATPLILLLLVGTGLLCLFFLKPKLFDLSTLMLKVDLFAFGGGYASVPLMLHEVVDLRHWMNSRIFMDGIALGQVTPGPIVITATFVGYLIAGLPGAIIGTISIFTPSLIILTAVVPYFDKVKENPVFKKGLRGVLASFVGLLLAVTIQFSMAIHWDIYPVLIALAAFIALRLKQDIFWVVIIGAAVAALVL